MAQPLKDVQLEEKRAQLLGNTKYSFAASISKTRSTHVPETPGVYAIWETSNGKLLYIGRAGEGQHSKRLRGLKDRLASHRRGTFSATSLAIAIWFRLLAPMKDASVHQDIADLRLDPSDLTREHIRQKLSYSFVQTQTSTHAEQLEKYIHDREHDLPLNNFRRQARRNAEKRKKSDDSE